MNTNEFNATLPASQQQFREPVKSEQIMKETVVHEHIHPLEKTEVQPVIYREREQLDIKQVTQKLHETDIRPTLIEQRELAPEYRQTIVERGAPVSENVQLNTREIDTTTRSQVVHAPIVQETVKKTIVEEIQPVLERDVIAPTTVHVQQPIYEKVIEAPIIHRETVEVRELGMTGGTIPSHMAAQPPLVQVPLAAQPIPVQPIYNETVLRETYPVQPAYAPAVAAPLAPAPQNYLYNPNDTSYTPPHALGMMSRGPAVPQAYSQVAPIGYQPALADPSLKGYNPQPLGPTGLGGYAAEGGNIVSSTTVGTQKYVQTLPGHTAAPLQSGRV